ncbi:MAG TPA: hypothetical protein VHQ65_14195 [Thermoanaerobaculia bacterium]|nr:hypothetical protein [Thermoanaerobaculia bacterium]
MQSNKAVAIVGVVTVGLLAALAAPTASAQLLTCETTCTCASSCDDVCRTGPFTSKCPECSFSTCDAWGVCDFHCSARGTSDPPGILAGAETMCTGEIPGDARLGGPAEAARAEPDSGTAAAARVSR